MSKLYDFQTEAVTKLVTVPAGLNGDDMGLGKTPQGIVIDLKKRELHGAEFSKNGKPVTLVVCPLSVVGSWVSHYKTWAPHLTVVALDPKKRDEFAYAAKKGKGDVFICHWNSLRLIPDLKKIWWFHVIGDEIHRIKNKSAQQTMALKALHTSHKLGLSGTPADNAPQDLWSILNWLYPKTFSSHKKFVDRHVLWRQHTTGGDCTAIEESGATCGKYHPRAYREILGCAEVEELHRAIGSFYVRRLKEDVLKDLPEKYFTPIPVELHPQQRRAYDQMAKNMLAWIGEHEDEPVAAPVFISALVRLQQFACAYARVEYKLKRKKDCEEDLCVDAGSCQGHLMPVVELTDPSIKLDTIMDIIDDNPGKQIGIFAQSRQVIEMLERRLEKANISSAILTGKTKPKDRDSIIEEFQAGKRRIFGGTYGAGGVGITLTAASTCIRIDRPWSPSADNQAVDRFHRIGQKNAVQVIDLVANDTVDIARAGKVELKWSWLRQILGDEVARG